MPKTTQTSVNRVRYQAEGNTEISSGGTGISSYAKGDMLFAPGVNSLARRSIGTNGQRLTSRNGLPQWETTGDVPPIGVQGDILYWNVSEWTRLTLGTNNYFLQANSTAPVWFDLFGTTNTWTAKQTFNGGLEIGGGFIQNTTRITDSDSPYTVLVTDNIIFCDTDGGAITVNLPAGVDGTNYRIINCGTSGNVLTISPNGSENLIGSNSSITLDDSETIILNYETTEGWY